MGYAKAGKANDPYGQRVFKYIQAESGKILIEKSNFNLEDLIGEMVRETELTVTSHIIKLEPCKPVMIDADHDKIASVITNLISNAVKY